MEGARETVSRRRFGVHDSILPRSCVCVFLYDNVVFCKTRGMRVGPIAAAYCDEAVLDNLATFLSPAPASYWGRVRVKFCLSTLLIVAFVSRDTMTPRLIAEEAAANRTAQVSLGAPTNHPVQPPCCWKEAERRLMPPPYCSLSAPSYPSSFPMPPPSSWKEREQLSMPPCSSPSPPHVTPSPSCVSSSRRPPSCPSYPPGKIVTGNEPPRECAGERDDPAYGNRHQLHQQGAGRAGEVSRVVTVLAISLHPCPSPTVVCLPVLRAIHKCLRAV